MSAPGTHADPMHKPCFTACPSCFRCADKGRYTKCNKCSGCMDPAGKIDVDPEHFCDCAQGVFRWRTKEGRLIIKRYNRNPFAGEVKSLPDSQDKRDFQAYLQEYREKMENPYVSPISVMIDGRKAFYNDDLVGFYDENGNQIG